MRKFCLGLLGVATGWMSTIIPAQAQTGICGQPSISGATCHKVGANRDMANLNHRSIYTVGSSIGIGTNEQQSTTITRTPAIPSAVSAWGNADGQAKTTLTGPGSVSSGAYTENINHTDARSLYLGGRTTIHTNAISTTNNVNWATAVSTGNGTATVSASGQNQSTAFGQSGSGNSRAYAGANAASQGIATATLSGPGTAQAKNTSWTSINTTTNAVYNGMNLTQAKSQAVSSAGSISSATATGAGAGSASAIATAASSAQALAATGNTALSTAQTTGSVSTIATAPSGSVTAVASTQHAATAMASLPATTASPTVHTVDK